MNLSAHGIRVGLPPGWEGRIYKRPDPAAQPVVHAANVALAPDDGDFATRTAELMPADGEAGYQRFFNDSGRAFGLYVVIGAAARARSAMPKVDGVLATIEIDPLPAR